MTYGGTLFAAYYNAHADPYAEYRDKDIAVEIETTEEQLEWGFWLRKNNGKVTINWGDGVIEEVSVSTRTNVKHVYPSQNRYVMCISDASGINYSYTSIGSAEDDIYSPMVTRIINYKLPAFHMGYLTNAIIEEIWEEATSFSLYKCTKATANTIPATVVSVGNDVFQGCSLIHEVYFRGTPTGSINSRAFRNSSIDNIYVPWSSTDTINANAPWGATKATIHYSYTT